MKNFYIVLLLCCFAVSSSSQTVFQNSRGANPGVVNDWAPFYHGVASGDPLSDRVIIWTRVTPDSTVTGDVEVAYVMAIDTGFTNVVSNGIFTTSADRDFTVKVDVVGLSPSTTYYYAFKYDNRYSLTGRTRTTPASDEAEQLKFGVVSCSNYQAGYFNAYQRLAERNDLDAIVHLGDYIYEYADQVYGDDNLFDERQLHPESEIVTLEDYRIRYSTYRLDTQLVRAHQQHPFIAVWDDHESANDSYKDGAQNHTEGDEGTWEDRLAMSKQAYFEWMPIRDNDEKSVYRTIKYGDLCDIIMVDTRIEGREEQINDVTNPALYDINRTLMGSDQKAWFLNELSNSSAKWKVIGNQVIFSEFNVGWAADTSMGQSYAFLENLFLDIWDGYPAERDQIIDYLTDNSIDNVVFLTGDFHSSFAFDVAKRPSALPFLVGLSQEPANYDAETQSGSIAVEFATPSITSANFDENVGVFAAAFFESQINATLPGIGINPNPHLKFTDLDQHGYFILDLTDNAAQADYYYGVINEVSNSESYEAGQYAEDGSNKLNTADSRSNPKTIQEIPAPKQPMTTSTSSREYHAPNGVVISAYPNPVMDELTIQYAVNSKGKILINITDISGKTIQTIVQQSQDQGLYTVKAPMNDLTAGVYLLNFEINHTPLRSYKIIKQ